MTLTEIFLMAGLLVAATLVAVGCFLIALPVGLIISGVLLAALVVFTTFEVRE